MVDGLVPIPRREAPMDIREVSGRLVARAPAKLNLFLEVLSLRPDGYHEIVTIMQAITLYDEIAFERTDGAISLATDSPDVPADETNLVWKAAEMLRSHAASPYGARISLTKRIAVGAGMGGGSSDAAATLIALNRLWALNLQRAELHHLAARLGSDVPFFLQGGTCLCRGRGEIVEPLSGVKPLTYVVVMPGFKVSTKEVYQNCRADLTSVHADYKLYVEKLRGRQLGDAPRFFNRLESVTTQLVPQLRVVSQAMNEVGLRDVTMTGSGSAFFAAADGRKEAKSAVAALSQLHIGQAVMAETVPSA